MNNYLIDKETLKFWGVMIQEWEPLIVMQDVAHVGVMPLNVPAILVTLHCLNQCITLDM